MGPGAEPGPGIDYSSVTEHPSHGASEEQMDMLRTRYAFARDQARGKRVVELACGTGIGLGYLARGAAWVVGGDYTESNLRVAQSHYGGRIPLLCLDAQSLPFRNGVFDLVLLYEAIYYLGRPEMMLREALRVLAPGGRVIVVSVNREWSDFNPSPFSVRYFSGRELESLLKESGFRPRVLAAFPARAKGLKSRILSLIKRGAVRLGLVPKTMKGKAWLKRLFYGRLRPLPAELPEDLGAFRPPQEPGDAGPWKGYKVLYALGDKE